MKQLFEGIGVAPKNPMEAIFLLTIIVSISDYYCQIKSGVSILNVNFLEYSLENLPGIFLLSAIGLIFLTPVVLVVILSVMFVCGVLVEMVLHSLSGLGFRRFYSSNYSNDDFRNSFKEAGYVGNDKFIRDFEAIDKTTDFQMGAAFAIISIGLVELSKEFKIISETISLPRVLLEMTDYLGNLSSVSPVNLWVPILILFALFLYILIFPMIIVAYGTCKVHIVWGKSIQDEILAYKSIESYLDRRK